MKRFDYDILQDIPEENDILHSSETVQSIQLPAYATDEQRRELFLEIISGLDEVSYTSQRLRLDVGKDFITLKRELGGGWKHREEDMDIFETPTMMSAQLRNMNTRKSDGK